MYDKISEYNFSQLFLASFPLKKLLGDDEFITEEIDVNWGIPDLVVLKKNDCLELENFYKKYKIIASLVKKNKPVFEDNIINLTGLQKSHFKKSMNLLIDMGVVNVFEGNKYLLKEDFKIPKIKIWSFEFKLSNWKSAFRQSVKNRAFSSYSYVIMPSSKRSILEKNKNVFNRFNVGSLTFDHNENNWKLINKPKFCGAKSFIDYVDILGRIAVRNFNYETN